MYWYKNHPESSTPHNNNTNTLSHKNILSYYDLKKIESDFITRGQ